MEKTGPALNISVALACHHMGGTTGFDNDETYIAIEVSNVDDRKTTITHLFETQYKSFLHKLFNRKNINFVVGNPAFSHPLPYVLEPGERWIGGITQNREFEEMSRDGILYCGVYHSSSKKPVTTESSH